ncbi:hypothetical protein AU385_07935 [Bacillus halotolerans]|nr:hypothetical protein AU385_07935 [Bacillus halotolerans]OEC80530.1 hypothetical protein BCV60_19795 [Bacillus halotolerans]
MPYVTNAYHVSKQMLFFGNNGESCAFPRNTLFLIVFTNTGWTNQEILFSVNLLEQSAMKAIFLRGINLSQDIFKGGLCCFYIKTAYYADMLVMS